MIELKKITITSEEMKDCIALDVAPEQKDFVYPNAIMLALEYNFNVRNKPMECYAIYAEGTMVGLIAYNYYVTPPCFKETCYRIRPLMVDKTQRGKGYEEAALKALLKEIRKQPNDATAIFVTYDPKEEDMARIYETIGFVKTDLILEGDSDIVARISM